MKSTGIVRKVDELGRIVLPIELRRTLGIEEKDSLEIYVDEDSIVLKKYSRGCQICATVDNLVSSGVVTVCTKCLKKMAAGAK